MSVQDQMKTMTNTVISITENIVKIANANALKPPVLDIYGDLIQPILLTERQAVKKIIVMTSGVVPSIAGIPEMPAVDENTAHLIVYGKFKYREDGTLSDNENKYDPITNPLGDPECVYDPTNPEDKKLEISTRPIDEYFPLKQWVKNAKDELKKSFRQIALKQKAVVVATDGFVNSIIIAATTVPGYSLPTALNPGAIKKTFSDVSVAGDNLSAKVSDLIDYFNPILQFLPFLVPETPIVDTVLGIINAILTTLNVILEIIASVMPPIMTVASLIPFPDMPSLFTASDLAMVAAVKAASAAIQIAKSSATSALSSLTEISIPTIDTGAITNAASGAITEAKKASEIWVVILGSYSTQEQAVAKQTQLKKDNAIISQVLNTIDFPNLTEELEFVLVAGKNMTSGDAQILLDEIKAMGVDVNMKNAGYYDK